jgi:hypothetical protein
VQVFTIASSSSRSLGLIAPAFVIVTVSAVVLISVFLASKTARFEVSAVGLRLRGDFYGRLIRPDALVVEDVRRVDFARSPELETKRRTMGTGLPGYQAGWFRLANGETALLYLTDRAKAVYVPTTNGYALIVSPDNPERFMAALREMRGR